jgi:two-component system cell cycle response regulator
VELEEQLRLRATRDALTGLWSRGALFEILAREIDRAKRSQRPLSMLIADIDHFKRVNDQFGHLGGDAALREAAVRMQKAVRTYDIVGRYGGEEIMVVLPECDSACTTVVAERIRHAIGGAPIDLENGSIALTISVGGTTAEAGATSVEGLIARADAALYKAKSLGRNRVEFSAPT